MEELNPTEEQIREFWEWCGLTYKDYPINYASNSCEAMCLDPPLSGWYDQKEKLVSFKTVPKLDLNNLFKWAVPKLEKSLELTVTFHRCHGNIWSCLLTTYKGDIAVEPAKHTNPALALYKAIEKLIDEVKQR